MTTTIHLHDDTTLIVQFPYSALTVQRIKALPPGTRAWDGDLKAWLVPVIMFEELVKLLPYCEVHPDVWEAVYPSHGRRLAEAQRFWQGIAWSGVRLVRDGARLVAQHDRADPADLAALQKQIDARRDALMSLWEAGLRFVPVADEERIELPTESPEKPVQVGLYEDPDAFMAANWEKWMLEAQRKRAMVTARRKRARVWEKS